MSMASPTLRSSSTMVPLPSFRSWLTSMPDLPSTAETVTGTSNTASRSEALRLGSVSGVSSPCRSAGELPGTASRPRSGSWTSSLDIVVVLGEMSGDQRRDGVFERLLVALHAAAAPFDAAIGIGEARFGCDLHAAVEPLFERDIGEARLQRLDHGLVRAHGEARLAD